MNDGQIEAICRSKIAHIRAELPNRAYSAANMLRNVQQTVMAQEAGNGGRLYRVPGTKRYYRASAPGEIPAVRTGSFKNSWRSKVKSDGDIHKSIIESTHKAGKYVLGDILENGTPGGKMAPRPHQQRILDVATPKIVKIYKRRYF